MWWVELLNSFVSVLDSGGAGGGAGSFESIATLTASGGETSLTFSSIPSTYKSLQIRGISRRNATGELSPSIRLNSDTGANYTLHYLRGNGSAVSAAGFTGQTQAQISQSVASSSVTSDIFGVLITDIIDYASTTKNKTIRTFEGSDANGSGYVGLYSNLWASTSAVTSVQMYFQGDTIAAGTTFALYGIKGA